MKKTIDTTKLENWLNGTYELGKEYKEEVKNFNYMRDMLEMLFDIDIYCDMSNAKYTWKVR